MVAGAAGGPKAAQAVGEPAGHRDIIFPNKTRYALCQLREYSQVFVEKPGDNTFTVRADYAEE